MAVSKILKRYVLPVAAVFAVAAVFFWIVHSNWEKSPVISDSVSRTAMAQDVGGEREAVQEITVIADAVEAVSLDLYVEDPAFEGRITVTAEDGEGNVLARGEKPYSALIRDGMNEIPFETALAGHRGETLKLRIHTDGGLWLGYGNAIAAGKIAIPVQGNASLLVGGDALDGCLVMTQNGWERLAEVDKFWPAALIVAGVYLAFAAIGDALTRAGKKGPITRMREAFGRYQYLLKQLVLRDFKVKYKASTLGVLWSFLNPLLMTLVYYVVFSNLFSAQENFVVYLMTGTVLFNYVSEATSLGLSSIVGNAGLITKVYMPKYIFPISKTLSSAINLLISMIPMLVLMALRHLAFSKALLLIPVLVLFLVLFCTGLALMLSSFMVFFRDTQFLWSVLLLMWNFLSPVFYPESIIPVAFRAVYRMNPLYQFMSFLRSITLNATAPGPECFGYCLIASAVSLCIGLVLFRRLQRRFAIYL